MSELVISNVHLNKEVMSRFLNKVQFVEETGCWLWHGALQKTGYGSFSICGKTIGAHRASCYIFKGNEIPSGYEADHICRTKHCVNPEHLRIVTIKENRSFGGRTPFQEITFRVDKKCIKGHNLSHKNLDKYNRCIECSKSSKNENYHKSHMTKTIVTQRLNTILNVQYEFSEQVLSQERQDAIMRLRNNICHTLGESTAKRSLKNILLLNGFDMDRKNVVSGRKLLKKLLDSKEISLYELSWAFGLKWTKTRLRKKVDGVTNGDTGIP